MKTKKKVAKKVTKQTKAFQDWKMQMFRGAVK